LLKDFYKSNAMKDSANSGEFMQWVDGVLVKLGFAPDQTKKAAAQAVTISEVGYGDSEFDKKIQEILATETGRGSATGPQTFNYGEAANIQAITNAATDTPPPAAPQNFNVAAANKEGAESMLAKSRTNPYGEITSLDYGLKRSVPLDDAARAEFENRLLEATAPSTKTDTSDAYDFKNLSTEDQINVLKNKRALNRYANEQSITKDLNPDEMQALQNFQMPRDIRSSMDLFYNSDPISKAAGGTKVAGGPAPASPLKTTNTNDSLISARSYDSGYPEGMRNLSGAGTTPPTVPVAAPPLETTSIDDKFSSKTPYALGYPEGMRNLSGEGITTEQVPFMSEKSIPKLYKRGRDAISDFIFSNRYNPDKETDTSEATSNAPIATNQTNAVTDFQVKGPAPERERVTNLPISKSIQTQMANVAPPTVAAPVLGGRGTMPEFDGRALSGDLSSNLVDPRNIFGEVGRGSGYDIPQQTITPGASAAFQDFTKQPIVTTNVPVKQNKEREEPSKPTIEKLQFSNFKANVVTTPSTKTGATIFGGNNPINPDGLPGKDSVGAFRNGFYAGDGMEWTEDGGRVYTGVNAGVTGDTQVVVAPKDVFSTGADLLGDYNIVEEIFGIGKEKKKKKTPVVKTGDGGVAAAKKIVADQKASGKVVSREDKSGEREAARAATKTTKSSTKKYDTQKEAKAATDKAVEKYGRATGGRAKGGLINKPKAKKTKTTNKRGLAARK